MEMESSERIELDGGSDSGDGLLQPEDVPTPPPLGDEMAQIPPAGSGERLGFLLGFASSSPSSSKRTQGGGARDGLPPVPARGKPQKRGRTPVGSSSDGDWPVPKKGKVAGNKHAQKEISPSGTSSSSRAPSESVNEISDDEDESGRDYVTANVFFPKICEIKMKIRQWKTSTDEVILEMCENMIQKFDKYWTDIQGLMGMATLLDPRYKRQMLVACYAMLHGIEPSSYECNDKVDAVIANLHKLIKEYEVEEAEYEPAVDSLSSMPAPAIMSFFHDIVAQQRPAAARVQGEIEHYLADDLVPYTEKFDVLDWWKVAGTRYPTLRKVARDIFAIPVTTVASESAFSMSGRIVTDHRSRLTSKMLEVLMCYQNWLRNKYKDAHMGEGSFWTCLQDTQEENEDSY